VEVVDDFRDLKHGNDFLKMSVLFTKYKKNDRVKENEMGRACSRNGGKEECI
jgi:hypothetical protein